MKMEELPPPPMDDIEWLVSGEDGCVRSGEYHALEQWARSYAMQAVLAERERAARIVELFVIPQDAEPYVRGIRSIAAAIRLQPHQD